MALARIENLADLPDDWDALLARQEAPTPFMSRRYLQRLQSHATAHPAQGWQAAFVLLRTDDGPRRLRAAAPLWLKAHSWGEYVFDQAWARAYAQHGLRYYPKGVLAVPFTPVPGSRLLAEDAAARRELVQALMALAPQWGLSGLHLLFGSPADAEALQAQGWATREQPQFHWRRAAHWRGFEDFLADLRRDKRKKIQQERRQVREAGVRVQCRLGDAISADDWAFWARCYAQTYAVRGQRPYLHDGFFDGALPAGCAWLLSTAERTDAAGGRERLAASLCAWDAERRVLYGRHWGCVQSLACLHFELCYYTPLEWALRHGARRFEGGAQGEHKMARGLLPVPTHSQHWLVDAAMQEAVRAFGEAEQAAVADYEADLAARSPFKASADPARPA